MQKGIECISLLIICCEGDSTYLTEEKYMKDLNKYIKENKPKFIRFNEIQIIKVRINDIFNNKTLIRKLEARGYKSKFSFIAIWKDNDNQDIVQDQNFKLISMKDKLFKVLKKYLKREKKQITQKDFFDIWILPKGWNFETYYRNHFDKSLNISDKNLKKKKFKESDFFTKTIFNEENFRIINQNLKKAGSNINLFNFEED